MRQTGLNLAVLEEDGHPFFKMSSAMMPGRILKNNAHKKRMDFLLHKVHR
jgi:hypothetical protein